MIVTYTPFTSTTLTYAFPTYTQSPACGYTWVYTLEKQDNTAAPSFMTQLTSSYAITTTSLSDAGTYLMRLSLSLAGYPSVFTPYEDNTLTWTVTVVDPCLSTSVTAFPVAAAFVTMTATVLGSPMYQAFSHPTDSYSLSKDVTPSYYTVPTPYTSTATLAVTPTGPAKGINICGARTYAISPATCQAYLTVQQSTNYAYLTLSPTLASQITAAAGVTCTVSASLASYPAPAVAAKTQTVKVIITACVVTSLSLLSGRLGIIEYDIYGSPVSVPFPTYSQTPACGYTPTYVCYAAINTAAM